MAKNEKPTARVTKIAGIVMRRLKNFPDARHFYISRVHLAALAGSILTQAPDKPKKAKKARSAKQ